MIHRHYILLVGNLTAADQAIVPAVVGQIARDWFNYTAGAWILCTGWTPQQIQTQLSISGLSAQAYYVILDISLSNSAIGMLPQDAWTWLKRHGLVS